MPESYQCLPRCHDLDNPGTRHRFAGVCSGHPDRTFHNYEVTIGSARAEWPDISLDHVIINWRASVVHITAQVCPLVPRIGDRFAKQTLGENLRCLFIEPFAQGIKQWHAVLLSQPEGVIDPRLTFGQFALCERFYLVKRLKVFQPVCGTTTRFLHAFEGVHEGTPRVGQAAEVDWAFERAPGGIPVGYQ
jgi:hypothetical protein